MLERKVVLGVTACGIRRSIMGQMVTKHRIQRARPTVVTMVVLQVALLWEVFRLQDHRDGIAGHSCTTNDSTPRHYSVIRRQTAAESRFRTTKTTAGHWV